MAENTPANYKRFAQSDKISQGTTNAALSLNDYLPGQHVTGPNNNDIAATLAQVQAIPIGTATLSGNTYNVTISNYPNTATIYPGQKISVKFNADAPTADDTALNLSAFGQSLPLCARGVRMGQGAIKSGMILELVYRGDMWNADYDVVKANRADNGYTTFADGQSVYNKQSVDNILTKYLSYITKQRILDTSPLVFKMPNYSFRLVSGFVEGLGTVCLLIMKDVTSISVKNLITLSNFSNTNYLAVTLDNENVKLSTTYNGNTMLTVYNLMHY